MPSKREQSNRMVFPLALRQSRTEALDSRVARKELVTGLLGYLFRSLPKLDGFTLQVCSALWHVHSSHRSVSLYEMGIEELGCHQFWRHVGIYLVPKAHEGILVGHVAPGHGRSNGDACRISRNAHGCKDLG